MNRLLSVLLIFLTSLASFAKSNDDYNYELEGAGTASEGSYLVKVTVITKDKKLSDTELKKAAVKGVLFRGFNNPATRVTQKPLAGSMAEAQHVDFFKEFFTSSAANYASIVSGSRQVVKSGKEYRVSAIVSVSKEQLLKDLQTAGIVKGLNSAF
ncbi:MAG: hypothetical protein NC207_00620 [Bacteroides sp.]|nr:hypothetical protein [Bacteroides sp.]